MTGIELDADGHRITNHNATPADLTEAENNLRDAINTGCTDPNHDHIADYRNALLKAIPGEYIPCGDVHQGDTERPCVLVAGHLPGLFSGGNNDHVDLNGAEW